jgi:hypothetical protein
MPELLALVACEKVLFDEGKNPSLIVLMEKVEALIPEGQQLPPMSVAPKEWAIFAVWKRGDEETVEDCVQHIEIVPPGKEPNIARFDVGPFKFIDKLHRVSHKIFGMPVAEAGTCLIKVRLSYAGKSTSEYSYPLEIVHGKIPATTTQLG